VIILRCRDPEGRSLVLHDAQWIHHILNEHPELAGQLPAIEATIRAPDIVCRDAMRTDRILYYRLGTITRYSRFHLKVCAHVFPPDALGVTTGEVVSAYLVSKPKRGEVQLWP